MEEWELFAPEPSMGTKNQSLSLVARIYAARGADLLRYVRHRLGDVVDARDIAHEAFLRFIRLENAERIQNPDAYIFRIAGNLLWERQLRRQQEAGQPLPEEPSADENTTLDLIATCQAADRLHAALHQLPVMQRSVLLLHVRDGLTFAEIARQAGISNTMAKKHLKNAIAACQKLLQDLEDSGRTV